jgi:hypothetical protein
MQVFLNILIEIAEILISVLLGRLVRKLVKGGATRMRHKVLATL